MLIFMHLGTCLSYPTFFSSKDKDHRRTIMSIKCCMSIAYYCWNCTFNDLCVHMLLWCALQQHHLHYLDAAAWDDMCIMSPQSWSGLPLVSPKVLCTHSDLPIMCARRVVVCCLLMSIMMIIMMPNCQRGVLACNVPAFSTRIVYNILRHM